ncbi:hypothetical protein chiPu_0029666, partial [Chiloscyllium punctatum]|nr:hypothetical protein [Chiloscyllium punctatum]
MPTQREVTPGLEGLVPLRDDADRLQAVGDNRSVSQPAHLHLSGGEIPHLAQQHPLTAPLLDKGSDR